MLDKLFKMTSSNKAYLLSIYAALVHECMAIFNYYKLIRDGRGH